MLRIFKHHIPVWSLLELIADSVLCFVAVLMAAAHLPRGPLDPRDGSHDSNALLWASAFAVLMALLYSFVGLYRRGAIQVGVRGMLVRGFLALFFGSCVAYLSLQADGSEQYALLLLIYAVPVMAVGVVAVRSLGYLARRASVGAKRVLVIGTGADARGVADQLATDPLARFSIVGFCQTRAEHDTATVPRNLIFRHGTPIPELVRTHRVDEIIVAVREQRGGSVPMDDLLSCRISGTPVLDLAGFYERARGEVPTDSVKASWLVYGHGFAQGGMRTAIKRAFDVAGSLALLIVAAPIMAITAVAIKLESRGPVIYRQERMGLGGRPFMCLKFRSMSVDAEKDGVARWATQNDSRITRVGEFIRKCRIDELPQLISVLRGEMSLVGPRPERPSFVEQLKAEIPFYEVRHCVKPGVTGWAQVRYSYGASVEDARRKHQFDLYYVKNHSLFLDVIVLIETVSVVLFREGAR
jgi:sugar transferase (PEP-CTERM system associated)